MLTAPNIAYGAPSFEITETIAKIKKVFAGKAFAWWVPPSGSNTNLTEEILKAGLKIETSEYAMICDLDTNKIDLHYKTNLKIQQVLNHAMLEDFISVLEPYDRHVKQFYEKMTEELFHSDEKLIVGYINDKPVAIGILFIRDKTAGIFSILTNEDVRGKGYGTDMMTFLLNLAQENNCKIITLSASSDAGYRIYERLGFAKEGEFECFEYDGE